MADEICLVLDEATRRAGRVPKQTVSDQGTEFGEQYLDWCDDHHVRARFGAVGRHGSIAVEERFIRTLKEEGPPVLLYRWCDAGRSLSSTPSRQPPQAL
jgi:transposase InsO family protein